MMAPWLLLVAAPALLVPSPYVDVAPISPAHSATVLIARTTNARADVQRALALREGASENGVPGKNRADIMASAFDDIPTSVPNNPTQRQLDNFVSAKKNQDAVDEEEYQREMARRARVEACRKNAADCLD